MRYSVLLEPDAEGRGYTARVPALPGCVTEGTTKEEALENAHEAIEGFIEGLRKAGDHVPGEKQPAEVVSVVVG